MSYLLNFKKIEDFSKKLWEESKVSESYIDKSKEKEVILDFFPYPSGVGLHIGHTLGYIATDIYARFKKLKGKNVLYAMGYDSFGLPAEQFAMETGQHPSIITDKNISNIKKQLKLLGLNHDDNRTFSTTDVSYYKWTQSIFLKLYNSYFDDKEGMAKPISELESKLKKEGKSEDEIYNELSSKRLAYLDEVKVNWCPKLGTVLSNEEVIGGLSERGSFPVIQKPLKQWVLRITKYSKRLVDNLDLLDWPESVKEMQRNWIGLSNGYEVQFEYDAGVFSIYTTKLETLSGVTYCAISSEHPDIEKFVKSKDILKNMKEDFRGIFTGSYAIHPLTSKKIPIYIADYVLPYGSAAVMGVPAHDERDYAFAKEMGLEVIPVLKPSDEYLNEHNITLDTYKENAEKFPAFVLENILLNGKSIKEEVNFLSSFDYVKKASYTKMRDWIFSRQRYWGEPFPIVLDSNGSPYSLEDSALPVELPFMDDVKFKSESDDVYKPLDDCIEWKKVKFIKLNASQARIIKDESDANGYEVFEGTRETNTMPNWAGSCWYYLRYMDSKNNSDLLGEEAKNYWEKPNKSGSVDLYLGGAEHAVLHLLYARFWHMVLFDLGFVNSKEPFQRLFNQGMILGPAYKNESGKYFHYNDIERRDNEFYSISSKEKLTESIGKIGKRYKNGVTPEEVCSEYSIDALRLFMMYLGPLEQSKPWDHTAIKGMVRVLEKVHSLKFSDKEDDKEVLYNFNVMLKKIESDFESLKFNTAISSFIIFLNKTNEVTLNLYKSILIILSPIAPHLCDYLYNNHFEGSIFNELWPSCYDVDFCQKNISLVISINGKKKEVLSIGSNLTKEEVEAFVASYAEKNNISYSKLIVPPKRDNWFVNLVSK